LPHRGGKRVVGGLCHVDVIVGMNGSLAAQRRACDLTTAVRNDFVHVHIELRSAAGHPDMQRKHVIVLAGQDFFARLYDQIMTLLVEAFPRKVGSGSALYRGD